VNRMTALRKALAFVSWLILPWLAAAGEPPSAGASTQEVAALIEHLGLVESPTPVREMPGWRKPRKVLVWNVEPAVVPRLQAAAPGVELLLAGDMGEAVKRAGQADASLGFCSAELLAAGPDIRWIQAYSAGVERCVAVPALRERGILLTNMQRVAGPVMAEHVMAFMLAYARALPFYIPERAAARWTREPPPPNRMISLTRSACGSSRRGPAVARGQTT
jgi:hypothetical protein